MYRRSYFLNAVLVNSDLQLPVVVGTGAPVLDTQAHLQQYTSVSTVPYNQQALVPPSVQSSNNTNAVWDYYQRQLQNFHQAAQQVYGYNQFITQQSTVQQQYTYYQPSYLTHNEIAYSAHAGYYVENHTSNKLSTLNTPALCDKTPTENPRPCSTDSGIQTDVLDIVAESFASGRKSENSTEVSAASNEENLKVLRQAILKDIGIEVSEDSSNLEKGKCEKACEKEIPISNSLIYENSNLQETSTQQCELYETGVCVKSKTALTDVSICKESKGKETEIVLDINLQKDLETKRQKRETKCSIDLKTDCSNLNKTVKSEKCAGSDTSDKVSERTLDRKIGSDSNSKSILSNDKCRKKQCVIHVPESKRSPNTKSQSDRHLSEFRISKENTPKERGSHLTDTELAARVTDQVTTGLHVNKSIHTMYQNNRYFSWNNNDPPQQHQRRPYHQMPHTRHGNIAEERHGKGKRRSNTGQDGGGKRSRDPTWGSGASNSGSGSQRPHPYQSFSPNAQLNDGILSHFVQNHQTPDMFRRKLELRNALHSVLQGAFKDCGLYIVGSSMTGFATKTSDMDICLMISDVDITKSEAIQVLQLTQRAFQRCGFLHSIVLIRAAVPILRFRDMVSNVECDMNINNFVGIYNTHLLKYYSSADWRLRPLMLFLKKWARFHDINDAAKQTLSSYTLSLMCIHYLQCGCEPCVLPSLQKLHPDIFNGGEIRSLRLDERLMYHSENNQHLGDLLLGFLNYYANGFDFDTSVVSVRLGTKIPFHMTKMYHDNKGNRDKMCLKVEEPFELTNTARSCYDPYTFERVKRVIRVSYRELAKTRRLESLFKHPF